MLTDRALRVAFITVCLVLVGARAAEADDAGIRATLEHEIPGLMRASHTTGLSIALVDGQRTVWTQGFGYADRAAGRRVTTDTLFHIGSTSKTMTALAVMQLVESGKVDLDAPLSRYVPQFRMRERFPGDVVTVRSVLDMHSGIPGDILNGLITLGRPYPGYRRYLLRVLADAYPERRVDTVEAYSNTSYALLQDLVEHVSGQDFVTYTHEHLFAPMGMATTTFDDTAVPDSVLSKGYDLRAGAGGRVRVVESPREYINGWATGSVVSSATEMAAYLKTLVGGGATPTGERILDQGTLAQMTVPQTDLPLDLTTYQVGLGWTVGDSGNAWMGPALHWNGGTTTFQTFFRWLPKLGLGAFVSSNTPGTVNNEIGMRALGLMVTAKTGRKPPEPARPARVVKRSTRVLARAAGRYASAPDGLWRLTARDGALLLSPLSAVPGLDTRAPVRLLPRADGWFAARQPSDHPLGGIWFKPRTVAGRHLLMAHYSTFSGPAANGAVAPFAQRLPAGYRIPAAWRARVGTYRATNIIPGSAPGAGFEQAPPVVRLTITHGVLEWNGTIEQPSGPRLAFAYGMSPSLARGTGDALVAAGDTLTRYGITYRRLRSAARCAPARCGLP
jgi:CubicO group peptidase (beta-lactamase class C family)